MQAGFDPKLAHLGTPVAAPLPSARGLAVKNSLANEIFLNSLQYPDMSVNEKKIVFREQAPMLQGMQLTHVPTGGFPLRQPSIIIGAGPDGIEYNTRMPTLFTQPSVPDKRMLVMPDRPLTGENGGETVYREPDNKMRNAHGAMSVKRAAQEAASGKRHLQRSREQLFNEAFTPEENAAYGALAAMQNSAVDPTPALVPTPTPTTTPPAGPSLPVIPSSRSNNNQQRSTSSSPPSPFQLAAPSPRRLPRTKPTTSLAETNSAAVPAPPPSTPAVLHVPSPAPRPTSFWHTFAAAQRGFWDNLGKLIANKMSGREFLDAAKAGQQWTYVLLLFLFVLLVVFFVVMIVLAARR